MGTPCFQEVPRVVLEAGEPLRQSAYSVACLEGVAIALVLSGVVGIVARSWPGS